VGSRAVDAPTGDAELREALRRWLAANWDPELSLVAWRTRLAEAGWARPSWPTAWGGRELPAWAPGVVDEELAALGAVGVPEGVGMLLAAPTVLEHGDDDLRRRFLRPTVTGELTWCQLFSEPGAGSDLAGLQTHAARDGDAWIVRGQKVWTTSAAHADVGLLLARTDPSVPKHAGITCFILPMRQQGVVVRPLRQMNGHASFNEVFLDDAHVPPGQVVGAVNGGWAVALTTLANERRMAILSRGAPLRLPAGGRAVREAIEEHERVAEPYRWYPQRAGRVDLVPSQARARGRASDPLVRDEIAHLMALARAAQLTAERAIAARAQGRSPGPEGSIGKLASSRIARAAASAHTSIAGATAMLAGTDAPLDGIVTEVLVSVPAVSIAGGTDEIQHNILGERILGLPKERDPARAHPFAPPRTDHEVAP
jgi:alkylation response protein AidB-like acyl-CoA dehydrogenase